MASGFSGGTAFDGSWHSVAFRRNGTAFNYLLMAPGSLRLLLRSPPGARAIERP